MIFACIPDRCSRSIAQNMTPWEEAGKVSSGYICQTDGFNASLSPDFLNLDVGAEIYII